MASIAPNGHAPQHAPQWIYAGSMSRSFYVGENMKEEDIHAKYENGILTLDVPKEQKKAVPEKRYIAIEG